MTSEKKIIIEKLLKRFEYDREFETEHFLYWIKETYTYNKKIVSRDVFKEAKNYVIKHGTLPFIPIENKIESIRLDKKKKEDEENSEKIIKSYKYHPHDKNINTNTHSIEVVLRYSKKYDNLELYKVETNLRASVRRESDRVLVLRKRIKLLSVNSKNYVLFSGRKWLSLKNWSGFTNNIPYMSQDLSRYLLKLMLGGPKWVDDLSVPESIYISNKNSRVAESLNHAIELECGARPSKTIKRALENNTNEIISLYKIIDPNQVHNLTNFIRRNHGKINSIIQAKKGGYATPEVILFLYFASKDVRAKENMYTVMDYFRMLRSEGMKINLNISSYRTIKEKHDEISNVILQRSSDKRRLKVSRVYPKISSIENMDVEQIRTAERLNMESAILHHCVHSYKTNINKGTCSIYSLVFNEERYTLQVNAEKVEGEKDDSGGDKYLLKAVQLKGKYNCSPPTEMKKFVQKMCEENNIELTERVVFTDKKKEIAREAIKKIEKKKEINQIGEAILDVILKESEGPQNYPF